MKLNDVERPLEHFHYDTFRVPENPLDSFEKLTVSFRTDPDGEISSLSAPLDLRVADIIFKRVAEARTVSELAAREAVTLLRGDGPNGQPPLITLRRKPL